MAAAGTLTREQARQQAQQALLASAAPLRLGPAADCPLGIDALAAIDAAHPAVRQVIESGLTAQVLRVQLAGRDWALKKARVPCRVANLDGQVSFLNELQRRADIAAWQAAHAGALAGVVPTTAASLRHGVLLMPWIDGEAPRAWDARQLEQLFDSGCALIEAGLFEWDFSAGNLLDDGRSLRLFDFGYCYPFDPLRQFNSAGNGDDAPHFHLAERFEARCFFAHLLSIEQGAGADSALAAFRREKEVAQAAYRRLASRLRQRGAGACINDWLLGFAAGWQAALGGDLAALYLAEGWRSHARDLEDDLKGRSCTPMTLRRADWLLEVATRQHGALRRHGALAGDEAALSGRQLVARIEAKREQAQRFQLAAAAP